MNIRVLSRSTPSSVRSAHPSLALGADISPLDRNIRNFVIISHVDHGKSTLADRLLEITGTVPKEKLVPQFLDRMPLERERGITIKMQPVRMLYQAPISADQNTDKRGLLYEDVTYKVRGATFNVYNKLGPAFKEGIYQKALEEELKKIGLSFEREKAIDVMYEGRKVGVYRPDFVVDSKVIIEIKALPFIGHLEKKQVWHYLNGSPYRLALLINFGGRKLHIERFVYDNIRENPHRDQHKSAQVEDVILNLIDTPGHSDFSYEVSRGLAAVEGAVLLVDATKGVQAQTLANFQLAKTQGLTIIPAVNKIDLPTARLEEVRAELVEVFKMGGHDLLEISGKTGAGVETLLAAIIARIPEPTGEAEAPLRALVFDSYYDTHKGIIAYVRVYEGVLQPGDTVRFLHTDARAKIGELGVFCPDLSPVEALGPGEIGYVATGLKEPAWVRVGDTITSSKFKVQSSKFPPVVPLPGYQEPQPLVFSSFYPTSEGGFGRLKTALGKLHLNDAAFTFQEDQSGTLGRGFRCGFLGTLHQEITEERLKREYGQEVIVTQPSVMFEVRDGRGRTSRVTRPGEFRRGELREVQEPWLRLTVLLPPEYVGELVKLLPSYRAVLTDTTTLRAETVAVTTELPLAEFFTDFAERLQSVVSGYASFFYEPIGVRPGDLVLFEILVHGEPQEALSQIMHRARAQKIARERVEKLKRLLPRGLFPVALQAVVDGVIVARETVPALRKDVTGYLYGGDFTRKQKLLKKQKRGKRLLAEKGSVTIPPTVFRAMARQGVS